VYHVTSRTSCGQFLFDDEAKGRFLKLLRKQAGFCGVDVLAYCVMGNHFHLLVAVPEACEISDSELLRRYRLLYNAKQCPPSAPLPDILASLLEQNEEEGQQLRARLLARMHDLSAFVRELKQRFGIWYNHRHGNKGTIWADRFNSVIVESTKEALSTVAAYIDLNPVRAGLVEDPLLYEWSGYGEAGGGSRRARRGLCRALNLPQDSWETRALPRYRLFLYDQGLAVEPESESLGKGERERRGLKKEARTRVIAEKGEIPVALALRKRVATFSSGVAVGGEDFVKRMASHYRQVMDRKRERNPKAMREGEGGFFVMRE
jgi:REP element-mobilizing transposase RayT